MVRPRPWRRLDIGELRSPLSTYAFCQLPLWPSDVDAASLYGDVISTVLDILPACCMVRRWPLPSDLWFTECRAAKRLTRRLECLSLAAFCRAVSASVGSVASQANPLPKQLERRGRLSVVLIVNFVIGNVRHFGRISSRLPPTRVTSGW